MRSQNRTLAACALFVFVPALATAQSLVGQNDSIYTWRGEVPSRASLVLRNVNGPIEVRLAAGNTVELRAEKRTSRGGGSVSDVAFEVRTGSNGDVEICSTFRSRNPCDSERTRRGWDNDNDGWVSVNMTLLVPRGVKLRIESGNGALVIDGVGSDISASTGNGRVTIRDAGGSVRANSGNGDVSVSGAKSAVGVNTGNGRVTVTTSTGPVEAHSGNGDIDVSMSAVGTSEDMSFRTGNGAVRVTLPANYSGELDASSGHGELRSDFDLKVKGRLNPQHIRATIGDGGPQLRIVTGSGRMEIRKN